MIGSGGGWYPVFLREMLLFRRNLLRVSYLFSTMILPILYLVAFGFGLGRNVRMGRGDYLDFLIPGLAAMTSMTNSYTWVANSLNLNRLYMKTFQVLVQSPIGPSSIMVGEVLAGMVKGLFASVLILAVGFAASDNFGLTGPFALALFVNCFLFASMGVIVGMSTRSHEDTATYTNFLIMPMAFFSGTFFPVDGMPTLLKAVISVMPLTHTNILIRKTSFDSEGLSALLVMLAYALVFFIIGTRNIRRYSE